MCFYIFMSVLFVNLIFQPMESLQKYVKTYFRLLLYVVHSPCCVYFGRNGAWQIHCIEDCYPEVQTGGQ